MKQKIKWFRWRLFGIYQIIRSKILMRLPVKIRDSYVQFKIKNRTGKCLQCGQCCWWDVTRKYCDNFDEKNKICKIQNTKNFSCKTFPIDNLDLFMANCKGFSFSKKHISDWFKYIIDVRILAKKKKD